MIEDQVIKHSTIEKALNKAGRNIMIIITTINTTITTTITTTTTTTTTTITTTTTTNYSINNGNDQFGPEIITKEGKKATSEVVAGNCMFFHLINSYYGYYHQERK